MIQYMMQIDECYYQNGKVDKRSLPEIEQVYSSEYVAGKSGFSRFLLVYTVM